MQQDDNIMAKKKTEPKIVDRAGNVCVVDCGVGNYAVAMSRRTEHFSDFLNWEGFDWDADPVSVGGVRTVQWGPRDNMPQKIRDLLELKEGITVVEPERPDECCGFGGMFSIEETAVCAQMGKDKVERHMQTGAEYITGPDCSCLMHMAGVAKKQGLDIKFKHVVEILAAGL